MHYFTSQLPAERAAARSLRASHYAKKRLREPEEDQDDDSPPSPSLTPQHDHPPTPFPHAPTRTSTPYYGAAQVYEEMAKPPISLYATTAPERSTAFGHKTASALKLKHLNVLSTLMHRCLLQGDYERAGRAWGIILRTRLAGAHPVDPRNNGRWGIGAEILLRCRSRAVAAHQHEPLPNTYDPPGDIDVFSDEGFELAKEYYQRLIIQHPHRRNRLHAIDERYFYPAMFSLWIFQVCENSKHARKKAQEEVTLHSQSSISASFDSDLDNDMNNNRAKETAIHTEELSLATEIAERLDQLIASPPFDQEASLLQLRGHICLWISHLHTATTTPSNDADHIMLDAQDTQLTRITTSTQDLQRAKEFFKRAADNGAPSQAATLSSIEIRIRELAQRVNRSRSSSSSVEQDESNVFPVDEDRSPASTA